MTHGYVELNDGFRFFWSLEGIAHPEIIGHIEQPSGAVVKGSAGWFRTDDPETAARTAKSNLESEAVTPCL